MLIGIKWSGSCSESISYWEAGLTYNLSEPHFFTCTMGIVGFFSFIFLSFIEVELIYKVVVIYAV